MTVKEVAGRYRVSEVCVRNWVKRGRLTCLRPDREGGIYRFRTEDLEEFDRKSEVGAQ
jgi:excisionase family DNA binding protein